MSAFSRSPLARTLFVLLLSGVALLVIMLTLKLLEMASMRDAMIVIFLSYFVVLTNFLYSQTIPTALLMLVAAFGGYDVASWPKPLTALPGHEGWTWGAGQYVFADSSGGGLDPAGGTGARVRLAA